MCIKKKKEERKKRFPSENRVDILGGGGGGRLLPNRDSNPQPFDPEYTAFNTKPPDCQYNHDIAGGFTCDVHITDVCILAKHHAFVGMFLLFLF